MSGRKIQAVPKAIQRILRKSLEDLNSGKVQDSDSVFRELEKELRSRKSVSIDKHRTQIAKNHKTKPPKPMTVKELLARDIKSMKDFKEGRTISQDEIKRRFKNSL